MNENTIRQSIAGQPREAHEHPLLVLSWILILWAVTVSVAAGLHWLLRLPPAGVQAMAAASAVVFGIAVQRTPALRAAVGRIGIRSILAFHAIRFVGIYFLWLGAQGSLPQEFAERAGWGDIAAATGALALIAFRDGPGFRRPLFAWNLIGMTDLAVAIATAARLNLAQPGSMKELAQFPLALVPLWIVPMLILSHLYLLFGARTRLRKGGSPPIVPPEHP
ncbi:MAG TPA: hypothetical protein VII43_09205 [Opitutaceae bacterium]